MSKAYSNHTAQGLVDEREFLLQQIQHFSQKLNEAQEDAKKIISLETEIKQAQEEKKILADDLVTLKQKIIVAQDLEYDLKKKISTVKDQYLEFSQSNELLGGQLSVIQRENNKQYESFTALTKDYAQLQEEVKNLLKQKGDISRVTYEAEAKNQSLSKDCTLLSKSILEQQVEKETLETKIEKLKFDVKKTENSIDSLVEQAEGKTREIEVLKEKILEEKQSLDNLMVASEQVKEQQRIEFEKREGELSEKESRLQAKEAELRNYHAELEKFYGKKLPIII